MLKLLSGLSGTVKAAAAAVAAASLTFSLMTVYDLVFDDPAVARDAKSGLVKIAEVEAAKAALDAQMEISAAVRRLAADRQRLAEDEARARRAFETRLIAADEINTVLQANIDEFKMLPLDDRCDVRRIFGRLRNP